MTEVEHLNRYAACKDCEAIWNLLKTTHLKVDCFRFKGSLRQYFRLYRVYQREGEGKEN